MQRSLSQLNCDKHAVSVQYHSIEFLYFADLYCMSYMQSIVQQFNLCCSGTLG
jgi:hypothetical protein